MSKTSTAKKNTKSKYERGQEKRQARARAKVSASVPGSTRSRSSSSSRNSGTNSRRRTTSGSTGSSGRSRQSSGVPATRGQSSGRQASNSRRTSGAQSTRRSSGSRQSTNRRRKSKAIVNTTFMDFMAMLPGFLLVAMTAAMLILDITMITFEARQYDFYPVLFHIMDAIIVVLGVLYWQLVKRRDDSKSRRKSGRSWYIRKLFERPENLMFGLFMVCIFISTVINKLDQKAVYGLPYRNQGIFLICFYMLIYFAVSGTTERERAKGTVLALIMFLADAMAIAAWIGNRNHSIAAFEGKKEISAIFFNGNHYGYFLCIAVLLGAAAFVISTNQVVRLVGFVTFILNEIMLMLNNTFGGILAAIISLTVLLIATVVKFRHKPSTWRRARFVLLFFLIFPLLGGTMRANYLGDIQEFAHDIQTIIVSRDDGGEAAKKETKEAAEKEKAAAAESGKVEVTEDGVKTETSGDASAAGHNRWGQWLTAVSYIKERPFFGYGCEGTSARMMEEINIGNPHNEILTYALYFGVPAAIFYVLGVLIVLLRALFRSWEDRTSMVVAFAAALGYFISSIFGVAMFYTTPFFFVLLGYASRE